MKEFVQISLETYNELKSNNENLKRMLKKEQASHKGDVVRAKEEINDLVEKIDQYKQYILERNCKLANTVTYSLEQYLDVDSWTYGMYYKDELLSLGITKQEMDEFIVDKYEKYVKEKEEEDEDDD
jgi:hypothetical protein